MGGYAWKLLDLFWRFLYTGLFTVGGGLASLPLLHQVIVDAGFLDDAMFTNMIAISQSTPGPIGVNLATYVGYSLGGFLGAAVGTVGIALPCFAISFAASRALAALSGSKAVAAAFHGVRAAVVGLIGVAAFAVLKATVFTWGAFAASGWDLARVADWKALAAFALVYALVARFDRHPALYVALGAILGVLFFQ
jgi:chromate transporter